ncbi:hypothetical protein Poli38472_000622 [Pythium oligandrum]|uniref:Magnesium transporter n=1 Tax=Pythium oligandrum TaxID=41045 RepID=A0A8K1CCG5_PYTOL|nr:hypothetical protein Poli38472_000622 [Pythium oligandrum]|eukprot:TMW60580.1 hypothetical protein Poli38472_000622 [Pythium oligandrum]
MAHNHTTMGPIMALGGDAYDPENADNAMYKWVGLGIVIGSAILSNLGVNVQKLSHVREEELPAFKRRMYYTRPIWIIGMILIVLGAIGDFEALGFAPQALVASVGGGCTVLANVFFAHLWLGQILTMTDVIGTLLIIIGVVLSTVVNEPDDKMSLEELEMQFFQPGFLVYLGVMILILGVMFGEIQAISRLPKRNNMAKHRRLPFVYATASGIFGSFSVLLAKCASILLILTMGGDNQFVYFTTYLFVGGMISTLVLQTDLLNRAIMVGDTVSVFPMFQCFWIGSSVVGGVVFYEKYTRFTVFEWVCLPIALGFIIGGIYLLSKHGEEDLAHLATSGPNGTPSPALSRKGSHFTSGHFGALMPLSPTHRASLIFTNPKQFEEDFKDENTPLKAEKTALIDSDQEQYRQHERIVV